MKHLSLKGQFICCRELKWKTKGWGGHHAKHICDVTEYRGGSWDVFMLTFAVCLNALRVQWGKSGSWSCKMVLRNLEMLQCPAFFNHTHIHIQPICWYLSYKSLLVLTYKLNSDILQSYSVRITAVFLLGFRSICIISTISKADYLPDEFRFILCTATLLVWTIPNFPLTNQHRGFNA